MAAMEPESDSEDELPAGWEERATNDGRVYYANSHEGKATQWNHPRTGKRKKVSGELPYGWEKTITEDGKILFVDHINKKTTYTDPRLAFAVEETDNPTDIRQRFDASTMALQILHGRDLSGKVMIVTGSNCGIGYETARSLAFHGAEVIMACRDLAKANDAVKKITEERPQAKLVVMQLDLTSLRSVQEFANAFKMAYTKLDVLILNAGIMGIPHSLTEDGFVTTFQVNHLSQFQLTMLLEPVLVKAAPSRVVVLSSESHRQTNLSIENISAARLSPPTANQYTSMFAYNVEKLCNVLFAAELQARWGEKGVTVFSVHPGNLISTGLSRNWWVHRLLFTIVRPFTKSLQQGASTSVFCAIAPEVEGCGGMYFNNNCRCEPSRAAKDPELAKKLWEMSEEMIKKATANQIQAA